MQTISFCLILFLSCVIWKAHGSIYPQQSTIKKQDFDSLIVLVKNNINEELNISNHYIDKAIEVAQNNNNFNQLAEAFKWKGTLYSR